ncbi:MAG: hypothetical protein DMG33_15020 [Acidobacteria bacterium]|nr:MAG: hypothetical protein DMG33_15020 [Acidobacteriota bacterium]
MAFGNDLHFALREFPHHRTRVLREKQFLLPVCAESRDDTACATRAFMTLEILLLGLGVGVLVGLFGIGGGAVLVPALVYLLRMDQHLAQGTSLFVLLPPVGLGALFAYWKCGDVDLPPGILCALGILAGGYLGSLIAIPMSSNNLKGALGCFLMLSAILLWRKTKLVAVSDSREKKRA